MRTSAGSNPEPARPRSRRFENSPPSSASASRGSRRASKAQRSSSPASFWSMIVSHCRIRRGGSLAASSVRREAAPEAVPKARGLARCYLRRTRRTPADRERDRLGSDREPFTGPVRAFVLSPARRRLWFVAVEPKRDINAACTAQRASSRSGAGTAKDSLGRSDFLARYERPENRGLRAVGAMTAVGEGTRRPSRRSTGVSALPSWQATRSTCCRSGLGAFRRTAGGGSQAANPLQQRGPSLEWLR